MTTAKTIGQADGRIQSYFAQCQLLHLGSEQIVQAI